MISFSCSFFTPSGVFANSVIRFIGVFKAFFLIDNKEITSQGGF